MTDTNTSEPSCNKKRKIITGSITHESDCTPHNLLEWKYFGVDSLELGKGDAQKVEEAKNGLLQCFLNSNLRTSPTFKKATVQVVTIENEIVSDEMHKYETEYCKCPAVILSLIHI